MFSKLTLEYDQSTRGARQRPDRPSTLTVPVEPEGSWIAQIKASNKNKGEALLIANDYRRFNYTPYAYRTKDYGTTWSRIVDENDVKSYTLSIVEDPMNANLLFLGTDDGLYISLNAGNQWMKWTAGFPTVSTKDLVIQPREHDLVIGTFGRAAWVLDDIRPLRAMANGNVLTKNLQLFTPPTAYQAAYQQPTGSRFGGDALFNGENKRSGAMISYYINRPSAKEEKKEKEAARKKKRKGAKKTEAPLIKKELISEVKFDSIKLEIFEGARLIRTLHQKAPKENGIHRMYWYMNEKGADRPSRKIRKRTNEPRGVSVKPGTYNLKMSFGNQISESSIKVEFDPRLEMSTDAMTEIYNTSKEMEKDQQLMADAVKQLVESKNTATAFKKDLTKEDKKKYKNQINASKDIIKKIEKLIAVYIGSIDKRQGITRNPEVTVSRRYSSARRYVGSRFGHLTTTEKQLISQYKKALETAISQTNAFFETDWKAYKTTVETIRISPFKEVQKF